MTNKFSLKSIVLALLMLVTLFTSISFADGLPGEYYITQRWRDLISPYSPATNPAFMTEDEYVTVRGAFSPSLGNTFVLYEGGVTVPIGLYQSVGISVLGVNSNEPIYPAIWDATKNAIVVDEDDPFYDNHFHIMGSYAINPWNRLSLGANVIFYRIPNFGEAISGFALDLGLTYRLANHPVLGEHIVGMSFQNVLSPDFQFEKMQQQSINGKISWIGKLWDRRIDLGIDLDFKDFSATAESFAGAATQNPDGSFDIKEGAKALEFDFNSRIGFWLVKMVNVYGLFGNDYIGAAAGMNVPTVFGGRDFQAAYQYMNMLGDNDIAYTHTVYFRGEFGPSREEIYAKKRALDEDAKPGDLWTKALKAYSAGEYWESMSIFGRLLTEFPDFFNNHLVVYYIGRCQEEMEMREVSMQNFFKTLSDYPASVAVPYANLGLLRLSYRDNIHDMVKEYHGKLTSSTVPDSIRAAADYYLGASYMNQGDNDQAISYFTKVPTTHDDYPFAQHSMAIAYAKKGNLDNTKLHLDNAIQFTPAAGNGSYQNKEQKKAQKEIRNRSLALIGFLYFEQKKMGAAISALREITEDSYYYMDGLLGSSWVAFKSGKWEDVKSSADKLMSKSEHPMIRAEAAIMLAYYHMNNKDYSTAEKVLEPAEEAIRNYVSPTDTTLSAGQEKYYENRAKYAELGLKADELIKTHETSYTIDQLNILKKQADELEKEVRSYDLEKDKQKRAVFFGRNPKDIKQAANYLLGKIKDYISQSGSSSTPDDGLTDEERKLMEELNKLQ